MKDTTVDTFLDLIWHRNMGTQIAEARRQYNKKRFVGRKWYDQKAVSEAKRKHHILLRLKKIGPDWDMIFHDDEEIEKEEGGETKVAESSDENKIVQGSVPTSSEDEIRLEEPTDDVKAKEDEFTITNEAQAENRGGEVNDKDEEN